MPIIAVAELQPNDKVLTTDGLVMYTIVSIDSSETTFAAEIKFPDSLETSQKFWSNISAEVSVDRT